MSYVLQKSIQSFVQPSFGKDLQPREKQILPMEMSNQNHRTIFSQCRKLRKKVKNAIEKVLKKKCYKLPKLDEQDVNRETSVDYNHPDNNEGLQLKTITTRDQITTRDTQDQSDKHNHMSQMTQPKCISCETRVEVLPAKLQITQHLPVSSEFKGLDDDNAMRNTRLAGSNLKSISEKLTRGCQTEISKVRVLFLWVVERDLGQMRDNKKTHRQCYHRIFKTLCRYASLRCEIIEGYSKGAGYLPCMQFEGNKFRNTWTAVSINNKWRFVNCTWAARHRTKCHVDSIDEFYFLTDPRDYIYQHFPDNPRWQLLQTPITISEFISLPFLRPAFLKHRLSVKPDQEAIIRCI